MRRIVLLVLVVCVSAVSADMVDGLRHIVIEMEGRVNHLPSHKTQQTFQAWLRADTKATVIKSERDDDGYLLGLSSSQFWKLDKNVCEDFINELLTGADLEDETVLTRHCDLPLRVKATVVWYDGERTRRKRIQIAPAKDLAEAKVQLFDKVILIRLYNSFEARFRPIP
jgi:hypothetical protein